MRRAEHVVGAIGRSAPARHGRCTDGSTRGSDAYARRDYVRGGRRIVGPGVARKARAQARLGSMYENGFGVPQAYDDAADSTGERPVRRSLCGEQAGSDLRQGHGVPENVILSYKWLDLAEATRPSVSGTTTEASQAVASNSRPIRSSKASGSRDRAPGRW